MKRRPLCMFCVLFLVVQTIRVLFFGAGDISSALGQILEQEEKEIEVVLEGQVYRIDQKESITAVYMKENAVSFLCPSILNNTSQYFQKENNQKHHENLQSKSENDLQAESQKEIPPKYQQMREKRILVYIKKEDANAVQIGNVLRVRGNASAFENARNPGNFDQRFHYKKQRIYAYVWVDEMIVRSRQTDRVKQFLHELRQRWKQLLVKCLGEYYGNTMSAILLGEKGGLDSDMRRLYQKNGIGHLLAISGLHMSFIGSGIYGGLRRSGVGFALSGIAGGLVLIFYTVMVGAGVSSMRALIMFLVRMGAEVTGRDYDLPTSLALAGAILCAKEPLYLLDAGFQLSFGALCGICMLNPLFETLLGCSKENLGNNTVNITVYREAHIPSNKAGKINETSSTNIRGQRKKIGIWMCLKVRIGQFWIYVRKGLGGSLAVNVFLLGPMLYFYFEIPTYSVLLNLLVIPMLPVAMGTGLLGSAVVIFVKPIGEMILKMSSVVLWVYDCVCSAMGELPFGRIVAGRPDIKLLAAYYAGLLLLCRIYHFTHKKSDSEQRKSDEQKEWFFWVRRDFFRNWYLQKGWCGCLILFLAIVSVFLCKTGHQSVGEIKVTLLDVGQGDGIFLAGETEYYMIDGGSSDVKQVGTYRIEPYLLSQGVDHLDYVFVTHGDEDHISGIQELLERQKLGIRVETLVLPPQEYHDEKLKQLAHTAAKHGTRVTAAKVGTQVAERGMAQMEKKTEMEVQSATKGSESKREGVGVVLTCIAPLTESSEALLSSERIVKPESGNEASLVLDLSYGNFDMIFTGDVEGKGEELLVESGLLRGYDVLKCAHHGSKNSGMDEFLGQVNPKAAVISAGADNRYGHPHKEALDKLRDYGISVYNTQHDGAVTIRSDGMQIWIESFLLSK